MALAMQRAGPRTEAWRLLLIFALVTVLYAPSLRHGFVYDDTVLVRDNPLVHSLSSLPKAFDTSYYPDLPYYRPVGTCSYVTDYALWGGRPFGFHLTNLLLHAVCTALFYLLCLRLLPAPSRFPAFAAALLFTVHPAVSSVVYAVTAREVIWSSVFLLAAALLLLRRTRAGRALSILSFALALLSKESAVLMPLALVAIDRFAPAGEREGRARTPGGGGAQRHLPYFVLSGAYLLLRVLVLHMSFHVQGKAPSLSAFLASWLYLAQSFLFPSGTLLYEPSFHTWFSPARAAGVALVLILVAAVLLRAPQGARRSAALWGTWIVAAYLPTANVVGQETRWDERYLYVAILGCAGLAFALLSGALRKRAVRAAVLAICLAAAFVTVERGAAWKTNERFCRQWLAHEPDRDSPNLILAGILRLRGDDEAALPYYQRALRTDPGDGQGLLQYGLALAKLGRYADAAEEFAKLTEVSPGSPDAFFNLGLALEETGRVQEAEGCYRRALQVGAEADSTAARALNQLGLLAYRRGEFAQGIERLQRALERAPGSTQTLNNLAIGFIRTERYADAVAALRRGLAADPHDVPAARNLARLLASCPDRALRDGREAERLATTVLLPAEPDDPRSYEILAAARAESGEWDGAVEAMKRAVALAGSTGMEDLVAGYQRTLSLYETGAAKPEGGS
jgi:tetratricopeptide (TPR) repeat protein